jgi:hypothetical protein
VYVCCAAGVRFCRVNIGDEGAILIAEGLKKNSSLKELRLAGAFLPHSFFIHCCHQMRVSCLM